MFSITRFGDFLPCPFMHVSFGNIFEEPLKDIIERALRIKWFNPCNKFPCLVAVDEDFITKVLNPVYVVEDIPIPYTKVFTEEDYVS
jgi:hypothetical protein